MSTATVSVHAEPRLLSRDAAARHVKFRLEDFDLWVRCGLIPRASASGAGWSTEVLERALADLQKHGCQHDNPTRRHSEFKKIPNCQRVWKKLEQGEGAGHWLFYFRPTGERLPSSWGSPGFMTALIECECRYAAQQSHSGEKNQDRAGKGPKRVLAPSIVAESRVHILETTLPNKPSQAIQPKTASEFLTAEEIVMRYRRAITAGTLRNWRSARIGPPFVRIGKAILYPAKLLQEWESANLVSPLTNRND